MQKYLRGQVWWCDCSYDINSESRNYSNIKKDKLFEHIQRGMRPVLIVSNDTGNRLSGVVQVVPCTTAEKKTLPTHCSLYIGKQKNTFLCEQMTTISQNNLKQYLITLDDFEMRLIERCIQISLGIEKPVDYEKIVVKSDTKPDKVEK